MACNGLGYPILIIFVLGVITFVGSLFVFEKLFSECANLRTEVEILKEKVKRLEKSQE